ncbi:hypothetical protein K440DRAFT_618312 [Wilcoxina mikolae CBS 423.85]|nr:hypothetical protein K440DRAFT_618312 [Wilcoxina mikolae CBS 423.85]
MSTIPSVTLLMHPGSRREYAVTVPTAPVIYTPPSPLPVSGRAIVPYIPQSTYGGFSTTTITPTRDLTYRPDPNQSDAWSIRVPDANGDGYHKWDYTHVHSCTCRKCERERERAREREREREMERIIAIRRDERRLGWW